MSDKELGVCGGQGALLFPFKNKLIGNIEPRGVFHTSREEQIEKDKKDGIKAEARYTTLNDIYELWKDLKRGLKNRNNRNSK